MTDVSDFEPVIHRAFARHAAEQPDEAALIFNNERISYRALEETASAWAAELSACGVGPGQIVPLVLPRSPQLVAAQLAILKCGAAYAGLDRRWPEQRQTAIIDQVSPAVVVSQRGYAVNGPSIRQIAIEDLQASGPATRPAPQGPVTGATPATVLFTSGSTGVPKGVVCPHVAVTRLFGPGGLPGFGPGHRTPQTASVAWDMYAFEVWGQLTSGGASVLVEENHLLPGKLSALVQTGGVDTVWLTTTLFNLFVDEDPDCFAGLGQVYVGGEKLSAVHVRRFLRRYPDVAVWNGYGPVEGCMLSTLRRIQPRDCDVPGGIPLGTAVPHSAVYILDPQGHRRAPGEPGEVCIAGHGLAHGYLASPGLTHQKFVQAEIDGRPVRVYRTGDTGFADDDGILHFRGRNDRQVKVSGHRVELAEIEAAVRDLPGIANCAAIPLPGVNDNVSRLALYYVTAPASGTGASEDPREVRQYLAQKLPSYMVPNVVRRVAQFPLTANGKLDEAALARLAQPAPGRAGDRIAAAAGRRAAGHPQ